MTFQCPQTPTIGDGVAVDWTPIGWSLRTTRAFARGEVITQYCGRLLSRKEASHTTRTSHLCSTRGRGEVIDGLKRPIRGVGGGSFANHSDNPNARILRTVQGVFLQATSLLSPGQTITIRYSPLSCESFTTTHGENGR